MHEFIAAIAAYVKDHNNSPRLFVWRAKAEDILEEVGRARLVLNKTATA